MKAQLTHSFLNRLLAVVIISGFAACDSLQEEGIPDPENPVVKVNTEDLYLVANSTGVLDLSRAVTSNVPVLVSIGKLPEQGALEQIRPGVYAYTPDKEFTRGTDRISLRVSTPSGNFSTLDTVDVHVQDSATGLPCNYFALNEEVVLQSLGESVVIDVFDNDIACSPWEANPNTLTIEYATANGTSRVEDGKIVYTHDPSRPMLDNIFYSFNLANCQSCVRGAYIRFTGSTASNCSGTELRPDHMTLTTIGPVTWENEFTFTRLKPMRNDVFCGSDSIAEKTVSIVDGPKYGHAQVDGADGSIKYWLALNTIVDYRDTITYQVCIADRCLTQKHALTVRYDPTCGIMAQDDEITLSLPDSESTYILNVFANDELCNLAEDVQITLVQSPDNGEAWVADGKLYFKHAGTEISAALRYTICTSGSYCSPRTAVVTLSR